MDVDNFLPRRDNHLHIYSRLELVKPSNSLLSVQINVEAASVDI